MSETELDKAYARIEMLETREAAWKDLNSNIRKYMARVSKALRAAKVDDMLPIYEQEIQRLQGLLGVAPSLVRLGDVSEPTTPGGIV